MMDLVAFALYIQNEWSSFAFDVAGQVVVVSQFKLWLEHDFDRLIRESRDHARHWRNFQ
jgi:hypothetical protein